MVTKVECCKGCREGRKGIHETITSICSWVTHGKFAKKELGEGRWEGREGVVKDGTNFESSKGWWEKDGVIESIS